MKLLAIEAAASPASVALYLDGHCDERLCADPRAQTEQLLEVVEQLCHKHAVSLADLDGIAVGRGPGSFTGLRVAAALAQGLAYSVQLPVANVSSLSAVAQRVFEDQIAGNSEAGVAADVSPVGGAEPRKAVPENALLVCLDARKAQVYCAMYVLDELAGLRPVSTETVMNPADVVAQFKDKVQYGAGNGFTEYAELTALELKMFGATGPSAKSVALRAASGAVAFEEPYLALPEYVRNNVTHGS